MYQEPGRLYMLTNSLLAEEQDGFQSLSALLMQKGLNPADLRFRDVAAYIESYDVINGSGGDS